MATFNVFDTFVERLPEGVHNLGADIIKCALTNTAPTQASDVSYLSGSSHPPPASANGYDSGNGGNTLSLTSSTQTSGTYTLVFGNTTFTASGGTIGPFRYAIIYNETASNNEVIGYYDYGSSLTLADGEELVVTFNASNGLLQVTAA